MTTQAKDIAGSSNRLPTAVSRSLSVSTSPTTAFHSPPSSFSGAQLKRTQTRSAPKQLKPFDTQDIKILLLENVNQSGRDVLKEQGYQVESLKTSLPEDQLIARIRYAPGKAYERVQLTVGSQRCPRHRNQIQNEAHGEGPSRSEELDCGGLFLHRDQPGRPSIRCKTWYCSV